MTPLDALLTRRSTSVRDLSAPAPDEAQLETILHVATRVPDHGKLTPWRIVVLREAGQQKLGALAADIFARANPDANEKQIEAERQRFARAPLCLAVLSVPVLGTKPVWEQELSAGAVCMNILHAAHALGFGAKWLTEWVAYDKEILAALLGVFAEDLSIVSKTGSVAPSPLAGEGWDGGASRGAPTSPPLTQPSPARVEGATPRIAGFIYLGTKTLDTPDRERPDLADVVAEYR